MPIRATHLHLIRESEPSVQPHFQTMKVWCEDCHAPVYVIHLNLPPEDPKNPVVDR